MAEKASSFFNQAMAFWEQYNRFRPAYPCALFNLLFAFHDKHAGGPYQVAVDYGSGPGTILPSLLSHFHRVVGTDKNVGQVECGREHLQREYGAVRVDMRVGAAGECDWLPSQSADMITAAEAVHWFDMQRWTTEAARVLRPGGTIAFWYYPPYCVLVSSTPRASECLGLLLHEREWIGSVNGAPSELSYSLPAVILAQLNKAGEAGEAGDALRFTVQCNVAQLDNIALDPTIFTNEERHKWQHTSIRLEISGPEPSMKTMAGETTLHVDAHAKQVNHPEPLLIRKGWKVEDLVGYLVSLAVATHEEMASNERVQALLAELTREMGGKEATFDVAWWLSLVMASRR